MMRKVLSVLVLFLSVGVYAQKAMDILDETASRIKNSGFVQVDFSATTFIGTEEKESVQGTMLLKEKKMVLDTPIMKSWFDGETQWNYIPQSGEVNVSNPSSKEMAQINPYSFLKLYKKGYRLSAKEATLRGENTYEVHLLARYKRMEAQEIYVDVRKSDYQLLCIRVRQDNTWTRIAIHNIQEKPNLTDEDFVFPVSQYPNVELIDLR